MEPVMSVACKLVTTPNTIAAEAKVFMIFFFIFFVLLLLVNLLYDDKSYAAWVPTSC